MNQPSSATNPTTRRERRKKTKLQIFKESYLPYLILLLAVVLCITFIVGSFHRAKQQKALEAAQNPSEPSGAIANISAMELEEGKRLMSQAAALAAHYDYAGAMDVLDTFSGDKASVVGMAEAYDSYQRKQNDLVPWTDMNAIPNLSFQMLVADPSRAFSNSTYGTSFNKNYVTTSEFSEILQLLYENDFVLISVHDLATFNNGVYTVGQLLLPPGKKPLVLTQTGVNYFTYMVDSDGDGLPDQNGAGFASRLVLDSDGKPVCEMVDASGNTVQGMFDLVPILDDFLELHPDFSYHGAKATLAVMGYDGIFGYRTNGSVASEKGEDFYQLQQDGARQIVEALKADGYDLACNTYDTGYYATMTASEIESDLSAWTEEVSPLLGMVDVLVYYNGSDIGDTGEYAGDKFDALYRAGFRYFIGQDHSSQGWVQVADNFVRQTRRLVTGARLAYDTEVFADLFDVNQVRLSADRGTVPN